MIAGRRTPIILALALVLVVTSTAYLPSLGNGFTNWDDDGYVTGNPAIKELSWRSVGSFFISFQLGNYHPLTMLSYALEYRFGGLNPAVYHGVNLALHLANTSLVLLVVQILSGSYAAALVASLLFGVHPLHVESVAWIAERKDVLSALFFFAALAAYLRHLGAGKGRGFFWLSFALFAFALLAKPMAVTFPLVMVLCDHLLGRRIDRASLVEKLPFFALGAVFVALALFSQSAAGGIRHHERFPLQDNVFIPGYGLFFYLAKFLLPVRLSALYPLPLKSGGTLPLLFLLSPIAAGIALAGFWRAARRSRVLLFGGCFFLVTIAPVLQLIPLGYVFAADRYVYIPSLGLCYLGGVGFSRLLVRASPALRPWRPLLWALVGGLVVVLSVLTWRRTPVWKDSLSLWNDVLDKYPRSSSVAWGNRGNAYFDRGDYDRAIGDYTTALEVNPKNALAWFNRGRTRLRVLERSREVSTVDGAIADLDRARELYPGFTEMRMLRGYALAFKGDPTGALAELNQAVRLEPRDAQARVYRGDVLRAMGRLDEAVSDYTAAIALSPGGAESYYRRANALLALGDHGGALRDYDAALERKPDYAEVFNNRGAARAADGALEEALADFSRAIEINPSYAGAYANRARLRAQLGMQSLAAVDLAMAQRLAAPVAGGGEGEPRPTGAAADDWR